MAKGNISKKQEEILQYIKDQILQRGFPPAVREICEAVHLKSTSSVHSHLETLEKNGYIRRDPTKPRAIEITDDSFQAVRTEMTSLPVERWFRFLSWDVWRQENRFWHSRTSKIISRSLQSMYQTSSSFF